MNATMNPVATNKSFPNSTAQYQLKVLTEKITRGRCCILNADVDLFLYSSLHTTLGHKHISLTHHIIT